MTTRKKQKTGAWISGVWQPNANLPDSFTGNSVLPGQAVLSINPVTGFPETGAGSTPAVGAGSVSAKTPHSYEELLRALGSVNGSDLASFLSQLGIKSDTNMSSAQIQDYNKQLLDSMLAAASEQDARNFNIEMRNEQRLYDNPLNQLSRLMGAGISRDAAIQMLSAGSGSGGAGSLTGDAAAVSQGISATQSDLNAAQRTAAIAQTVFGGIGAVTGLISLGISIPQAVAQVTAMSIQNTLSQKALLGLQSADTVLSALENAVQVGALSTQDIDGFSNATDALNYINDHKDSDAFKSLFTNGSFANVYGTKLGREMFVQAWKNVRSSKDDGTILDNYIQSQRLQNALTGLEADKIGAEMQKIGTEVDAIEQSMVESMHRIAQIDSQILVLNAEGNWINVQSTHMPKLWDAEIESLNVQTDINRDVFVVNHAGVPMLKQAYIDKCEFAAFHASTLNSKESREQYWRSWMMDAENARAVAFLKYQYNDAVGNFSIEHPHLWKLCQGLSFSGAFDGVKAAAETGAGAAGAANAAKTIFELMPK